MVRRLLLALALGALAMGALAPVASAAKRSISRRRSKTSSSLPQVRSAISTISRASRGGNVTILKTVQVQEMITITQRTSIRATP